MVKKDIFEKIYEKNYLVLDFLIKIFLCKEIFLNKNFLLEVMRYVYRSGEIIEEDGTVIRELKEVGKELI